MNNRSKLIKNPRTTIPGFSLSTPGRIRTDTGQGLSLMSLPIGLRTHLYPRRDSNSQHLDPKSSASSNWATRAFEEGKRIELLDHFTDHGVANRCITTLPTFLRHGGGN